MNELTTNTNTIASPKQAVEEYIGEQFIDWMGNYIAHEMQSWPIINRIKEARTKPEKLKKFALQIFLAAEAFLGGREGDPGFLRFAIANLSESDDPQAETALEILEKRRADEMLGHRIERGIILTARREQWVRLLASVGLTQEEIDRAEAKEPTRNYVAELSEIYSTSEWQTAIGAFAAHERAIVEEYKAFLNLLKNNLAVTDKDLEVLYETIKSSTQYAATTNHVLDKVVFDHEAKNLVWQGVHRQLEIRQEFLNGLDRYLSPLERDPADK